MAINTIPISGSSPITGNNTDYYEIELSHPLFGVNDLEDLHFQYGYGYGKFAQSPGDVFGVPDTTYFDVFGITSNYGYGYGYIGDSLLPITNPNLEQYGWGHELTHVIAADGVDSIKVYALVKKNGIAVGSGTRVIFSGSAGITFSKNVSITDSNGIATAIISMDSSVQRNLNEDGSEAVLIDRPDMGYMTIRAEIYENSQITSKTVTTQATQTFGSDAIADVTIPISGTD